MPPTVPSSPSQSGVSSGVPPPPLSDCSVPSHVDCVPMRKVKITFKEFVKQFILFYEERGLAVKFNICA